MNHRLLLTTFGAAALLAQPAAGKNRTAGTPAPRQGERPNILLFLVDDMGWQDTSEPFWKDTTPLNRTYRTPNMERLAQTGIRFSTFCAQSVSSPSRTTATPSSRWR